MYYLPTCALLALAALTSCRAGAPAPGPAPDVRGYGAAIRVDPATLRLSGVVRLAVAAPADGALELDLAQEIDVLSVRVDAGAADYIRRGHRLRVPLRAGARTVEVRYAGTPAAGLYAGRAADQRVIYTDSWPQRGAGWLPAVHHPSDPASLELALELPLPWEAVASGAARSVTTTPDGFRRWHFSLGADAPAYTFAFAAADFAALRDSSGAVPVTHYLLAGDSSRVRGLSRVAPALDTLAALLGPYPYSTFATVEVPLGFDGMENAAAVFLRAGLYRTGPRALEEVAFHEAAHQWLGNRVVPADWRDLWIAEGAATYLTTVLYERLDGANAARSARARMARLTREDATRPLRPAILEHPEEALSTTVYGKGGAVFHLLRLTVGDDAFFGALRDLAFRARPTSTNDLRRAMERASGADLGPFFAYWVHGGRVPVLRTHWDSERRTLRWRVEGAHGVLDGLPLELRLIQVGEDRVVPLGDGRVVMRGTGEPEALPVGVVMRVED